jgi:hypothetical protein
MAFRAESVNKTTANAQPFRLIPAPDALAVQFVIR